MSNIIFLMGVAGSGKTSVLQQSGLLDHKDIVYVPSFTTRPLRAGEKNGEKYRHIDEHTFQEKISNDEFIEYAIVHQLAMYGTDRKMLLEPTQHNKKSIKEIDMYGLMFIKENDTLKQPYTTIFLDIPLELMSQRITQRQKISSDELQKRIQSAEFEKEQAYILCDHIIDATQDLDTVCKQVTALIW